MGQDHQDQSKRSELQIQDSPDLANVPPYKYETLPKARKRIRLLLFHSGTTRSPEIFCELI
jgi:hypothetical protein